MKRKEFLLIAIGIFLTILAWLFVDIYQIQSRQKEKGLKTITILDYEINKKIFDILLKKQQ